MNFILLIFLVLVANWIYRKQKRASFIRGFDSGVKATKPSWEMSSQLVAVAVKQPPGGYTFKEQKVITLETTYPKDLDEFVVLDLTQCPFDINPSHYIDKSCGVSKCCEHYITITRVWVEEMNSLYVATTINKVKE
jgi:hypothetical protein